MSPVEIDFLQIKKLANLLKNSPEIQPFNFCDRELFPAEGDPAAVDFFFYATLHQFGFWYEDGKKYLQPMYGTIQGKLYKGSDFFWRATRRAKTEEPNFFDLEFRAKLKLTDFARFYRDDSGECPLPMLKTHWRLALRCAQDLLKKKLTPEKILERSNGTAYPLKNFLKLAGKISGYKEDPLKKKLMLLAVIYAERPERFLHPSSTPLYSSLTYPVCKFPFAKGVSAAADGVFASTPFPKGEWGKEKGVGKGGGWMPIVDYHVQRTALRTGLVKIADSKLLAKIAARKLLSHKEERKIRAAVFSAMQELEKLSRKSTAAIDWLFFSARKKCPEMTDPKCALCILDPVCAKRKELFQPVFRTTYY